MLWGRKVEVARPRVRGVRGGEITLPTWAAAGEGLLSDQVMAAVLAGVSTRSYEKARARRGRAHRQGDLLLRGLPPLHPHDLRPRRSHVQRLERVGDCAIFADGIEEADHTMVCALGLDAQGRKHLLGLVEGSSQNKAVCCSLFAELVERGLDFSGGKNNEISKQGQTGASLNSEILGKLRRALPECAAAGAGRGETRGRPHGGLRSQADLLTPQPPAHQLDGVFGEVGDVGQGTMQDPFSLPRNLSTILRHLPSNISEHHPLSGPIDPRFLRDLGWLRRPSHEPLWVP
ncbi:MAG: hypothetical protein ACREJP_04205 [Candidatus Methylomirabilales bacterium]